MLFRSNSPIDSLHLYFHYGHLLLLPARFGPSLRGDVIGAGILKRRGLSLPGFCMRLTCMRALQLVGKVVKLPGYVY